MWGCMVVWNGQTMKLERTSHVPSCDYDVDVASSYHISVHMRTYMCIYLQQYPHIYIEIFWYLMFTLSLQEKGDSVALTAPKLRPDIM